MRAAILGLGRWGQMLIEANALAKVPALQITHAATRTPQKAAEFCARSGLVLEPDLHSLLRNDDLDAIILATPHSQHAGQIKQVAASGRHVFVEKPLALKVVDAQDAIAACQAAGVVLAVGFNRRFLPAFKLMQQQVTGGQIGTPMHVEGSFCGPFGYGYTDSMWRGTSAENPAGGMAAMGIHILDAMIALMGPVRRVSTLSRKLAVSSQLDDTTLVHLDFISGATGSLSTLMATARFWRLHVFGAQGWAQMPDETRLATCAIDMPPVHHDILSCDTLHAELQAFADAILQKTPYPVTLTQALHAVAAMEAITASARDGGEWVDVTPSGTDNAFTSDQRQGG